MKEKNDERRRRARKIVTRLKKEYPDARCTLSFKTPHQLMVATILSAQCTDERVNMVTDTLFKKYRRPEDFARAPLGELEDDIRSTGFFRNKARAIKASSKIIAGDYGGRPPDDLARLVKLPGVGRKTASVILGAAYGRAEGIVVDTHVSRLSRRLGLAVGRDAIKIEKELVELIPKGDWIIVSHLLIDHGRAVCRARRPNCEKCVLTRLCPSAGTF